MDWLWPDFLLLLGLIPLLAAIYVWTLRRHCRFPIRYSSLSFIHPAVLQPSRLRKHLPFVLFLTALSSLVIAIGRPVAPEAVLTGRTTIILTLDISRSMCMRDIQPNRLVAAQAASLSFIQQPVLGTQIGIVAFSGFADLAQEPTTQLPLLEHAIQTLTTSTQTAIGSAILRSLDAIAEVDNGVASSEEISMLPVSPGEFSNQSRLPTQEYVPHIIVLLTDGSSNTGPPPLRAAQQAAERGVRIYAIGFGTTRNAVMDCWNISSDDLLNGTEFESQVGGGSFGSGPDEATLKQIAKMTGGEFYSATSASELQMVFQELHSHIAMTNTTIEVSALFAAIGTFMAMIAFVLSTLWHPLL